MAKRVFGSRHIKRVGLEICNSEFEFFFRVSENFPLRNIDIRKIFTDLLQESNEPHDEIEKNYNSLICKKDPP